MADSQLRCALVYRLEGINKPTTSTATFGIDDDDDVAASTLEMGNLGSQLTDVTVLAKLDYAKEYEVTGGASSAELYGGRDKGFAEAVKQVILGNAPGIPSLSERDGEKLGACKVVNSEAHKVVYGANSDGLCFAVIAGSQYSSRIANMMLIELEESFTNKFGAKASTATPDSLSKSASSLIKAICKKYNDPAKVDKTKEILGKVEEVKGTMADNIAKILENTDKVEELAQQTEVLSEQANEFKKKSTELKRNMWCKDMKMTIIVVLAVLLLAIIILWPLIKNSRSESSSDSN